ncbi:cytochrome c biogenesis protein [Ancylomarina sp. 16SWW S1-10-2]|uniref:cytochrome c biogenesis protein n=1 Tax=Ancylomarina sp. 16SWW S1-10-2 TaxID=2499681 RepID=UPI0012ADE6CE|nr:cytochrome c biogenesis protein CcsA [Ancylomarina sp. 16SWW S1-10-2]MRT91769.1 cytochrome C biogenesis protein [Ancylomarina sp. 16SWW S1-10-2]
MKKRFNFLFSMQMMGTLIAAFAISIGVATFIENDFGTQAAKSAVYNATWFEILLFFIAINLIANIKRYKLYTKKKWSMGLFHLAFIIILIGSGITRYVGYEGSMHIREGKTSSQITTTDNYVNIIVEGEGEKAEESTKLNMSSLSSVNINENLSLNNKDIELSLKHYIPNASTSLIKEAGGIPVITFVSSSDSQMQSMQTFTLDYNSNKTIGENVFAFGNEETEQATNFSYTDRLRMKSPYSITELNMMGTDTIKLESNKWHIISPRKLYDINGIHLIIKDFFPSAKYKYVSTPDKKAPTVLIFNIKSGEQEKELIVKGFKNYVGTPEKTQINGLDVSVSYGSMLIDLPFSIQLNDFQLKRYPGSKSPSSFASEVTLIDTLNAVKKDYRIYMNKILKYRGFRFYQSSYDGDEGGTILSVNHDHLGMMVTYFGYFLMIVGMAWSLLASGTRFRALSKMKSKSLKTILILVLALGGSLTTYAQNQKRTEVPLEQAKHFGELVVQDNTGRFEPVNTLASEVIRKISKKSRIDGLNADQVFLSMIIDPQNWEETPLIKVSNSDLINEIGGSGKYASFNSFLDASGQYKLRKKVRDAYSRKPANRTSYDKEIISVDERVNVSYMVFSGEFLKLFPDPQDSNHAWYQPKEFIQVKGKDSLFIKNSISLLSQAMTSKDYDSVDTYIKGIKKFQKTHGKNVMPSENKLKTEILYNKVNIFKRLFPYYLLIGFILIIALVAKIIKPNMSIKWLFRISFAILSVAFLIHTIGLGARWYISGHAPWSNGFESMTYVAWACLLAGFLFTRKSKFALAATSLLAGLSLFVAHLSWMNPEITNLVPVLKSYWLTIHVAIITGSYGFLALAAILGMISLSLMILKNKKNETRIDTTVLELSRINEMTMIIGLYTLTIGTILGGIWANESWGRYWGWDPKETWALVSVLVYSFVLHMRHIPGLKSIFTFNLASIWAYSSILMTYFGVNYYLAGLHSYAKGDPIPIPNWVYYTIGILIALSIAAYYNYRKYKAVEK